MIDKSREKNKTDTRLTILADFTPVPRQCNRHDGWTPERQRGFIEALADLGSVRAAAHAVNMAPEGAYLLRRHPEAHEFRKAWEAALKLGVQRLEDVAMERALHGIEVPVYHFGAIVGMRRHYNDRLLMFMLRNRATKRFAADSWQSGDAVSQARLKRLRAQWQKEWEEEQERNAPSPEEIRASIDHKIAEMKALVQRRLKEEASDKTRRLYAAYQQSLAEDEALREQGLLPAPVEEWEEEEEQEE